MDNRQTINQYNNPFMTFYIQAVMFNQQFTSIIMKQFFAPYSALLSRSGTNFPEPAIEPQASVMPDMTTGQNAPPKLSMGVPGQVPGKSRTVAKRSKKVVRKSGKRQS